MAFLGAPPRARARRARARTRSALKSLTELSADWFWETDAEHRITWLSGGGPVATLFGDTPTYGKRFWEIPRVEVDAARARGASRAPGASELPFFDLEIARTDERGARQVHIISGQSRRTRRRRASSATAASGATSPSSAAPSASLPQAKERLEMALDGGNLAEWHYDARRPTSSTPATAGCASSATDRSPPLTRGARVLRHCPSGRPPRRARGAGCAR